MVSRAVTVGAGVEDKLDVGSGSHERLKSNHYTEHSDTSISGQDTRVSRIPRFHTQLGRLIPYGLDNQQSLARFLAKAVNFLSHSVHAHSGAD